MAADPRRRSASFAAVLCGAVIGAGFFLWLADARALDPRQVGWTMRSDWQWHFLGWHTFRNEPWQLPPGRIRSELYPVGTSIAYTDSLPLVALVLKPLSPVLPTDFQYLGGWLLACFALQGASAALLLGCWTRSVVLRTLGAALVVLSPILLDRVGHVALCSHWLLLLALWLYFRDAVPIPRVGQWTALVVIAALIHPYLWLMVMILSLAALARRLGAAGQRARTAARHMAATMAASACAGWLAGWFLLDSSARAAEGLGALSMNLLGPIATNGISALLPVLPVFPQQSYEGFNYLGAGSLFLVVIAGVVVVRRAPRRSVMIDWLPLIIACVVLTMIAVSPRVTAGQRVLFELSLPDRAALLLGAFRVSGRFFWPVAYVVTTATIVAVVRRVRAPWSALILGCAIALQAFDLHGRFDIVRAAQADPSFYAWSNPETDPAMTIPDLSIRHIVVVPPEVCGAAPVPYVPLVYLAGRRHLTVNTGQAARFDLAALRRDCAAVDHQLAAGTAAADTLYVMAAERLAAIGADARAVLKCQPFAGVLGCSSVGKR